MLKNKIVFGILLIGILSIGIVQTVSAQDAYIGEIRMFAGSYVPAGWLPCEGQLLPSHEYQELYAVLGVTYGGDGVKTFALPNFRGRLAVHKTERETEFIQVKGVTKGNDESGIPSTMVRFIIAYRGIFPPRN